MKNKRIITSSTTGPSSTAKPSSTARPTDKFSQKLCKAFQDSVNSMDDFIKQADEIIALLDKAISYPNSGNNPSINKVINKILKINRPNLFNAINKENNNNLNKIQNYLCNNPLTETECKNVSALRKDLREDNNFIVGIDTGGQRPYSLLGKLEEAFNETTWDTKNKLLYACKKLVNKIKKSLSDKISKLNKIIENRC